MRCLWLGTLLFAAGSVGAQVVNFVQSQPGVELRFEREKDSSIAYLQTRLVAPDGRIQVLIQPFALRTTGDGEFAGSGLAEGRLVSVRVAVANDDSSLQWLQPAALPGSREHTVRVSGKYTALGAGDRLAATKEHFQAADKELNRAYNQLRERMATEDFVQLRANQRRWLKFRDWFVVDGDDFGINGPGTVPYIRLQTARTLDRAAFLEGLGEPRAEPVLSGVYSDGMDRELRLRAIPTVDEHVFFTLSSALPQIHDGQFDEPIVVAGVASPSEVANVWKATAASVSRNPVVQENGELLIASALDFTSVDVNSAESVVLSDRLYFVAELRPAAEPMREILLRLPSAILDHTTEGLSERAKTPLLLGGYYEPFRLSEHGVDHARLSYREGQVDVHRFALADGAALVAVATRNVRAHKFELWRISAQSEAPMRVELNEYLPKLGATDFYADADADSYQGWIEYRLSAALNEVGARWNPPMDGPEPDYRFDLYWDGYGFGRARFRADY